MRRARFTPRDDPARFAGAVLARDLTTRVDGRRVTLRRGIPLDQALERLGTDAAGVTLHVAVPDDGDMTQEAASTRLAYALAGANVRRARPHQGQVDLRSAVFGVLRVDVDAVERINRDGLALVATGLDGRVVEPGEIIAIVKASELLVPESRVLQLVEETVDARVVSVARIMPRRVALIAGERIGLRNLTVSSERLAEGLARFGASLVEVRHVDDEPEAIAVHYRSLRRDGVDLLLVAGSIVLDPEDPFLVALDDAAGRLVRRGAPIDPGTMFWVGYLGDMPVFGLASCEMYGRLSIFDLMLPYALAGQPITSELVSALGYGGLLADTRYARLPASWREDH